MRFTELRLTILVMSVLVLMPRSFANERQVQRDDWCTNPENLAAYRRMVADLNTQFACQSLEPRDCMVLTGAVGVGAMYGAAKGVEAHRATHGPAALPACQVSVPRPNADGFLQLFAQWLDPNVLVDFLIPKLEAYNPCGISDETRYRMDRMAQTSTEFARGEFERTNTAQRAIETNIRNHQATIERELQALRGQLGQARVNNLGLGQIETYLRSDQRALADGWNGFLRDRATRLRGEFLAATQAGDESAARLAAVEIREFIGTNFSEDVQRGIRSMSAAQEAANFRGGSSAVVQQVDALLAQAPEKYGRAAEEFSRLCSSGRVNCSEALKTALREMPTEYARLTEASRATNLARVQHRLLGDVVQAVRSRGAGITTPQARELLLRLTENMDRRFMIFGDFQALTAEMGYTSEQMGRLAVGTAGVRASAVSAGVPVEQAVARAGVMRGLVGVGGRALAGAGLLLGGASAALASTPVTALSFVLLPTNTDGRCNGSVPTSVYAETDEYCRTQPVFSERTAAFVSMPMEQQLTEMQRFPEMCAVIRETFDSVKSTRWQGQCVQGPDGRATGVRAKLRGNEEVYQEASWGSDGQMRFFRMYSPRGEGGIVRAGFGMNLEQGQPTGIRFRNEAAVRTARDFQRARLDSLNFSDPNLYEQFRPIPFGTDPNQVEGVQRRALEEIQLAQAQFQANRMSLTEMAACCQGNHLRERCDLYGITGGSAAPRAAPTSPTGRGAQ